MAQKKKYKIFCVDEDKYVYGVTVSETPPEECPNDPLHAVIVESLSIEELIEIDNLEAVTNPTINDDVEDGYFSGSRWVNTDTNNIYICIDNSIGAAVWSNMNPSVSAGDIISFSLAERLSYSQYLVSWSQGYDRKNRLLRSGCDNGIKYGDCAPIVIPHDSEISSATVSVKGVGIDGSTPDSYVNLKLELWAVGYDNEGTKITDLIFPIDSSSYTVGSWWDSSVDTNYNGSVSVGQSIGVGDMVAAKFVSVESSSYVVQADNIYLSLVLEKV